MPGDPDPRRHLSLSTDRMVALSDGVFGFAMTLLVLDIAVRPPGTALEQLLHAWPSYVAYVVSFLTIGGAWLQHTVLTARLARADPILVRLNLLVLLVVVFLPFPTRLIADSLHRTNAERVAVTLYGLTLLAIRLLGTGVSAYARREHLNTPHEGGKDSQDVPRKLLPIVIGYVIAILIGIGLPLLAVALYFSIAVYLVVPFREVRHAVQAFRGHRRSTLLQPGPKPCNTPTARRASAYGAPFYLTKVGTLGGLPAEHSSLHLPDMTLCRSVAAVLTCVSDEVIARARLAHRISAPSSVLIGCSIGTQKVVLEGWAVTCRTSECAHNVHGRRT